MADREGATDAIESLSQFRDCALETLRSSRDEMGAAGYLMKPFKPERLLDLVTRMIVAGA